MPPWPGAGVVGSTRAGSGPRAGNGPPEPRWLKAPLLRRAALASPARGVILVGPWRGYAQGCRSQRTADGRVITLTSQEGASAGLPTAAPAPGGPGAGSASPAAPVHG